MESVFVVCSILIYAGLPVDYLVFNMSTRDLMVVFVSEQSILLVGILIVGAILEVFVKKPTSKNGQMKPLI
jgi:hypothetical protein